MIGCQTVTSYERVVLMHQANRVFVVGSVFTCSNKVTRVTFVLHRKPPHADRSDQSQSSSLCDASTAISYLFSITPFGFLIMPELMILILILLHLQL